MPYIEGDTVFKAWHFNSAAANATTDTAGNSNALLSQMDMRGFYCPTRRNSIRPGVDNTLLLFNTWQGGGTDYGGCMGRHRGFATDSGGNTATNTGLHTMELVQSGMVTTVFVPGYSVSNLTYAVSGDPPGSAGNVNGTCYPGTGFGIFGQVNTSTAMAAVRDGLTNTVMVGELQRITTILAAGSTGTWNSSTGPYFSHDGWSIGGSSTLFSTGLPAVNVAAIFQGTGPLMNNGWFGSPGSDHPGGGNFGLGDASVRFFTTNIDSNIFCLMGSIADRVALTVPE